jgi:hypothetical protein
MRPIVEKAREIAFFVFDSQEALAKYKDWPLLR